MIKIEDSTNRPLVEEVVREGQEHVFRWWDDLSGSQRESLLRQLRDIDFTLLMVFKDETCTVKEGKVENPDVLIETDSEIILGITDGEISPTKAFMGGKLKAKGDMKDMLRIQMLMK